MEIRKVLKGKFEFVNNCRSNRSGFVHETTLFNQNGYELGSAKCQYYNRTWEEYQYKTVMRRLVSELIEKMQNRAIQDYKINNNKKRLSKEIKYSIIKALETNERMQDYKIIYKELGSRV